MLRIAEEELGAALELARSRQPRDRDDLNVDQRLKVAEIKALLAIGQELSKINDDGHQS